MRAFAIVILMLAAVALGIAGMVFLAMATEEYGPRSDDDFLARVRLTSGLTCLGLATAVLITAAILAFIAGTRHGTDARSTGKA